MKSWIQLLRPYQWIKNGFVWIGYLFYRGWTDHRLTEQALYSFIAFCALSSAVYIFNDWMDRDRDRAHPTKKNRPLVQGAISLRSAAITALLLASGAILLAYSVSLYASLGLIVYLAINLIYTLGLKRVPILDVLCIASGFLLRVLVGTLGLDIPPSRWLILCTITVSLFLGFVKRRSEILALSGADPTSREVLSHYNAKFLDALIILNAVALLAVYTLYTLDDMTVSVHHTNKLIYTVPFVAFAIFRYVYLLYKKGRGQDTARELFQDPQILVSALLWASAVVLILR